MSDRSEWTLLFALLVAAAFLALLVPAGSNRSALDPRPSSFRATPSGALGLFLLLEELEIPVERRTTPLVEGDHLPGALAILAPTQVLTPVEVAALLEWIDAGGRLIYAGTPGDTLLGVLGLRVEPAYDDSVQGSGAAIATPVGDHPLTTGVDSVSAFKYAFVDSSRALASPRAEPLLRIGDHRIGAVLLRRGEGVVLAWSDPGPLVNHSLQAGGAAVLAARAAREFSATGGAIHFDEFHHGFRGGGSPAAALAGFLFDTRAGHLMLQAAMAAAGLLILLGSRFGAPRPLRSARRRSPLEHLHALAAAYHAGNARNHARHLILAGAARRLGRRPLALGAEIKFLQGFTSTPAARSAADALLQEWRKGDDGDLTILASQVDRLVTETRSY